LAPAGVTAPCGYCGTQVGPGLTACPHCGIGLVDVTRHGWGHAAKEFVLDTLDVASDKARESRKKAGMAAGAAAALVGVAVLGARLLRRRKD
jgi:hypothetical protein